MVNFKRNLGQILDEINRIYIYKQILYSINTNGNTILAGSGRGFDGLYRTTNNGDSWMNTPLYTTYSLAVSGSTIFAGISDFSVYRSTNNGANWISTNMQHKTVYSLAISGSNIFAGTVSSGVYLSTNFSTTWAQTTLNVQTVFALTIKDNYIFAGTDWGCYVSANNGSSWNLTSLNDKIINSLISNGSNVFAGTSTHGVYLTTNNGVNWTQTTLNNKTIYSFAISGSNIFAGTASNGVYLSTNNGASWINKNQGFYLTPTIRGLLVTNDNIFAATDSQGVWRRTISDIIGIKNISTEIPSSYSLEQNYPNPFNSSTVIRFQVAGISKVSIIIIDINGREVQTLVNERLQAGTYQTDWNASAYPSGVYFYRMETDGFSETRKMMLLK